MAIAVPLQNDSHIYCKLANAEINKFSITGEQSSPLRNIIIAASKKTGRQVAAPTNLGTVNLQSLLCVNAAL